MEKVNIKADISNFQDGLKKARARGRYKTVNLDVADWHILRRHCEITGVPKTTAIGKLIRANLASLIEQAEQEEEQKTSNENA